MSDILFIGIMLWFIASIVILIMLKKRENRRIQEHIKQLYDLSDEVHELIIFLDYKSREFKEIDNILIEVPLRMTIVFNAPKWLVAAKTKKWGLHCVLDSNDLVQKNTYMNGTMIFQLKNGKYKKYNEVLSYMGLFHSQRLRVSRGV